MSTKPLSIKKSYDRLSKLPFGHRLFSLMVGRMAPYTGSISPMVRHLEAFHAIVEMKDHGHVRNHLQSVHAMALANLGEVATGLALLYGLPDNSRAILTGFSIEYVKKARGTLTAEASCEVVLGNERKEHDVHAVIRDTDNDSVARVCAKWLVAPSS